MKLTQEQINKEIEKNLKTSIKYMKLSVLVIVIGIILILAINWFF